LPKKLMASPISFFKILILCTILMVSCFGLIACGEVKKQGIVIGCSNNTGGMLVNFALTGYEGFTVTATDGISPYLMMDCCSSKSTWSLTSGELDGAVLCPDAADSFLTQNDDFLLAGPLTYDTEMLVVADPRLETIGYMNGQERQKENLEAVYGNKPHYAPVLAASLPYALSTKQIDAAVLDIGTAIWLDYPSIPLKGNKPTTVLVVHQDFYASEEYHTLLLAIENARAALKDFDAFQQAMKFLFTEEIGRKEYEKWLSEENKFPGQLKQNHQILTKKD